jgi:hypothetical protein
VKRDPNAEIGFGGGQETIANVNTDYWEGKKVIKRVEPSIKFEATLSLKNGTPSDAVKDAFTGNGGKYSLECGVASHLMKLHALQRYYTNKFGNAEGTYRFNRLFTSDEQRQKADAYLSRFDNFKKDPANGSTPPDQRWEQFARRDDLPVLTEFKLVVGQPSSENNAWLDPESPHGILRAHLSNDWVTLAGIKGGWIGENVIGFNDGNQTVFWGHPMGTRTHKEMSEFFHDIASIKTMSDFNLNDPEQWLTDGLNGNGRLSSLQRFSQWVEMNGDQGLKTWYKSKTGHDWTGPAKASDFSIEQVKEIIELALPESGNRRTLHDQHASPESASSFKSRSEQMAHFLLHGKPELMRFIEVQHLVPIE